VVSVALGAIAGLVGYISWVLDLGAFRWWLWAGAGGVIGLSVGLLIAPRE
jgi:hypothetical protein